MNLLITVVLGLALLPGAAAAADTEAKYDDQFEYASYAKAVDAAKERLADRSSKYDDHYEYAFAAVLSDMKTARHSNKSCVADAKSSCMTD